MSGSDRSNIFPWPGTMFLTGGAGASGIAAITGGVIANTAISGGTIDGTAITNSTMDGTSIGAYDPDTGRFTTLEVLGLSTLGRNSANYITVAGGNTLNPVLITPTGSDTNTDLRFNPKGQGVVHSDRFSVGTFAASSTYGANRRFTAFSSTTMSGSTPGATYRFGGTVTGTLGASLTGFFPIVIDSDTLQFSNTSHGMVFNYVGQTLAAGWSGGRATHQSYLSITGAGSAGDISGGSNAYHVSGSSFIQVSASMGGTSNDARGNVFGRNDGVLLLSGAGYHVNSAVGHEIDMGVRSGAEVLYKVGHKLGLWQQDAVRGAVADYGYSQQLTANVTGSQGWRVGYALGGYEAWWPYTSSSTLMRKITTAASIASGAPAYNLGQGINFLGITFTESQYKGPGFIVDPSGNLGALVSSGVSLQTRSGILAKTAVVNTITVVEGGLFVGAITLTCSAPTTSGTTATATVATQAIAYASAIDTRGSGWAVGDTFEVTGGTSSVQATGVITSVSAGQVYGLKFTQEGNYSVLPAAPITLTATSGAGTGLTITPTTRILTVSVTGAGTNYSEFLPPTVSSAGATTTLREATFKVTMTATQGQLQLNNGKINVTGIPTSSAGLASGDVYSNAGILTVVP